MLFLATPVTVVLRYSGPVIIFAKVTFINAVSVCVRFRCMVCKMHVP